MKVRNPRQGGRRHRPHAGQGERDQADICFGLERIDRELGRNELLQLLGRNFPMEIQEVMPVLKDDRRSIGLLGRRKAIDAVHRGHAVLSSKNPS